jgi:hypothetical protein
MTGILYKPKVYYLVHKLLRTLSHINAVHTLQPYFPMVYILLFSHAHPGLPGGFFP